MSFFSTILEKLGLKKEKPAESASASATGAPTPAPDKGEKDDAPKQPAATQAKQPAKRETASEDDKSELNSIRDAVGTAARPAAISEVDVVKKLETMAEGSGLNWKVSIVDLLKVLGIDASKDARIELAKELNCPAELIGGDYSKMNIWLHKEVLRQIAANGGNIPKELLD